MGIFRRAHCASAVTIDTPSSNVPVAGKARRLMTYPRCPDPMMRAYNQGSGGDTNVTAFSPATGKTYVIHCTGLSPHVCTGGTTNNASVYFP